MVTDAAYYRNPHSHRPTDSMDTLDFDFMARVVEGLACFFLGFEAGPGGWRPWDSPIGSRLGRTARRSASDTLLKL